MGRAGEALTRLTPVTVVRRWSRGLTAVWYCLKHASRRQHERLLLHLPPAIPSSPLFVWRLAPPYSILCFNAASLISLLLMQPFLCFTLPRPPTARTGRCVCSASISRVETRILTQRGRWRSQQTAPLNTLGAGHSSGGGSSDSGDSGDGKGSGDSSDSGDGRGDHGKGLISPLLPFSASKLQL